MRFIQLNTLLILISFTALVQAQSLTPIVSPKSAPNSSSAQAHLDLNQFPDVKQLLDQGQTSQAIEQLLTYLDAQANNPAYFNMLGSLYLKQKNYAQAIAQFERVVLIQPDNAGAWLDLAIASFEHGQSDFALGFFDYIESEFKPTPSIQNIIANYRRRIKIATQGLQSWSHQVDVALGHDTNANSGLSSLSLRLTQDGKVFDLPLEENYRARSDQYLQKSISTRFVQQQGTQEFELNLSAQNRQFFTEHASSSTHIAANANWLRKFQQYQLGASVIADHIQVNGRSLLNNSSLALNAEKNMGACTLSLAFDYDHRYFVTNTALNGAILWQQIMQSCSVQKATHGFNVMWMLRMGNDRPMGFRAGGAAQKKELWLKLVWILPRWGRLELSQQWGRNKDSEGYSPLLENNAIRYIHKNNTRLSWVYPLNKSVDVSANVDRNTNDSNISIFRQESKNFSLGLQKRF
jgi:tetratricopeptide (TPR) repeat protein